MMNLKHPPIRLTILLFALLFSSAVTAVGQYEHEYAPIEEKEIEYKNWNYENASGEGKTDLRGFAADKKLVLVFYFSPWCHASKFQTPITQRLYEDYKDKGLGVIGVSMYDSVESLRREIKLRMITFPVVVENTELSARKTSQHFKYRVATGDNRKWGTPWNIFLEPAKLREKGDVLTEKTYVVNGELREEEAEAFIRERLGLPPLEKPKAIVSAAKTSPIEECPADDN